MHKKQRLIMSQIFKGYNPQAIKHKLKNINYLEVTTQ